MTHRVDLLGPLERNQQQLAALRLVLARADKQDLAVRTENWPSELQDDAQIPDMTAEAWLTRLTKLIGQWARHEQLVANMGEADDPSYARSLFVDIAALAIRGIETIEDDNPT